MELVRRSFVNRPLSSVEQAQCDSAATFTGDVPALALLCHHLR